MSLLDFPSLEDLESLVFTNKRHLSNCFLPYNLLLSYKTTLMETLALQQTIFYELQDLPIEKLQEVLAFVALLRQKMAEETALPTTEIANEVTEIPTEEVENATLQDEKYEELLGTLLTQRYQAYKANPESASTWEEVQARLQKKYNWT